jgi:hypothetical protein
VYIDGEGDKESCQAQHPLQTALSKQITGHGGADFYTMQFFLDAVLDRPGKEYAIDVYQALDMTMPGILGYRSICEDNAPMDVPDMRDKSIRDRYRNDNWCADPRMAGPGQPEWSSSFGPVDVDDSVYEEAARQYKRLNSEGC